MGRSTAEIIFRKGLYSRFSRSFLNLNWNFSPFPWKLFFSSISAIFDDSVPFRVDGDFFRNERRRLASESAVNGNEPEPVNVSFPRTRPKKTLLQAHHNENLRPSAKRKTTLSTKKMFATAIFSQKKIIPAIPSIFLCLLRRKLIYFLQKGIHWENWKK